VPQTRDSPSAEPVSLNTSDSGEERATRESQSADPHDTNKILADSPSQDSFTRDSELHTHQRPLKALNLLKSGTRGDGKTVVTAKWSTRYVSVF